MLASEDFDKDETTILDTDQVAGDPGGGFITTTAQLTPSIVKKKNHRTPCCRPVLILWV